MKQKMRFLAALAVPAMLLCAAIATSAAQKGESPAAETIGTVFKWIHFAILAGITYWLFAKYLPPKFRRRADDISAAITKATAAKAEAERRWKEAERKLASLEQEVEQFRDEVQAQAAVEFERLRAITQSDVEKTKLAAKAEIEAAERAARVELKALAAKLAVDRAESLVTKEMTPAVQEAMINHFVQSLQGRPN